MDANEDLYSDYDYDIGGFGSALDQSVRKALRSEALRSTSRFLTHAWRSLARNLFIKPTELVKNIDELEFLKKQARPPSEGRPAHCVCVCV